VARKKITQLAALTSPASTDVLPIVDLASIVTKKSTVSEIFAAGLAASSPWVSVAFGDCTFTANGGGTWTPDAGDFSYYKWTRLNSKTVMIKGAVINSTISGAGSELRVTAPPGITFGTNDSFSFLAWSVDGFVTQDTGSSISRTASNLLAFKQRASGAWGTTADLVGVIWSLVVECTVVP